MQSLHLADSQFPKLFNQNDSVTIRRGWREISCGPLVFESALSDSNFEDRQVTVFCVEWTTVAEVPERDCKKDGCDNWVGLLKLLQQFYPGEIGQNTPVTVVRFWNEAI